MPRGRSTDNQTRRDRQAARTRGNAHRPNDRQRLRAQRQEAAGKPRPRSGKSRNMARHSNGDKTTSDQPGKPGLSRWQRIRRAGLVIAIVLLVSLGGGVWWGYDRLHSVPGYWAALDRFEAAHSDAQLNRMGQAVRNRLIRDLTHSGESSAIRGHVSDTRRIRLPVDQLNAWLAKRLDDWLANQNRAMPAAIGRVMVATRDDRPIIAFAYYPSRGHAPATERPPNDDHTNDRSAQPAPSDDAGDSDREQPWIVSLELNPSIDAQGKARVPLTGVWLGQMPVPRQWILDRLKRRLDAIDASESARRVVRILKGERFEPRWRIDSRAARLVGVEVSQNAMTFTIQHESTRRGPRRPADQER